MTKQEFCQKLTKKFKGGSVWEFEETCEESEGFDFRKLTPSDSNEDVKDLLYRFTTTHLRQRSPAHRSQLPAGEPDTGTLLLRTLRP